VDPIFATPTPTPTSAPVCCYNINVKAIDRSVDVIFDVYPCSGGSYTVVFDPPNSSQQGSDMMSVFCAKNVVIISGGFIQSQSLSTQPGCNACSQYPPTPTPTPTGVPTISVCNIG